MRFTALPAPLPRGVRSARPQDYDRIAPLLDAWWGRPILEALPRLFLDHFHASSLVAEHPDGALRGFLIGFASPSQPAEAYIHFVGIAPSERGSGLGRVLYETFFEAARTAGRTMVSAVTSPVNTPSIAFHAALGFEVSSPVAGYNGPGHDLVTFRRRL
ncbi:MAG: GNAT family N-acetyltransferase [Kineosporiaceae bacterium]|nr:GNAT family N-acetyltransferase [Kineosporiaceae bacterium]MBK7624151.1 GNAT family N-acetyltransferase [Kineosporiaceae bacterium]MBK8075904.1 GNAT family N-acetyltransferase [Kineosporiaceae bacterium]